MPTKFKNRGEKKPNSLNTKYTQEETFHLDGNIYIYIPINICT